MSTSAPPAPFAPLSAIRNLRSWCTRNDSHGSSIAGVVSDIVRTGVARFVMSITGTPGVARPATGVPFASVGEAVEWYAHVLFVSKNVAEDQLPPSPCSCPTSLRLQLKPAYPCARSAAGTWPCNADSGLSPAEQLATF